MIRSAGLITYHSAYNFGSVLQAYATQEAIRKLGISSWIIDYRPKQQDAYYSLLGYGEGAKMPIKKALMIPHLASRVRRKTKFERFIAQNMQLTPRFHDPSDLYQIANTFDCFISGSDQVWNLHSNEFIHSTVKDMEPYLLEFTERRKISYGSSLANMTEPELLPLIPYLRKFDQISCREKSASILIGRSLHRSIPTVADPTLLLDTEEWLDLIPATKSNNASEPYLLYYSLKNFASVRSDLKSIRRLLQNRNVRIKALTPLLPGSGVPRVEHIHDCGPLDFLRLIRDATIVITDSYHGTLFSIIFEKAFVYLKNPGGDHNVRAMQILSALGLEDQMVTMPLSLAKIHRPQYKATELAKRQLKTSSFSFLKDALR